MKFRHLLNKCIFMMGVHILLANQILLLNSFSTEMGSHHWSAENALKSDRTWVRIKSLHSDLHILEPNGFLCMTWSSHAISREIARYILLSQTSKELESFNWPYENHKIFLHSLAGQINSRRLLD